MFTKIKLRVIASIAFIYFFVFLASGHVYAASAGYQHCPLGSSCSIGEYLYDDSYTAITDATCTLTSRYPDGTIFLNAQSMTSAAENDGWYSYSFSTTGKVLGVYRSQISCVSGGETTRLDKTFIIESPGVTASDVSSAIWDATASAHATPGSFGKNLQNETASIAGIWSYPSRTLSNFGTLVADIWDYSTRSVTTFGSLVSDIWNYGTRTLTGGTFATKNDIDQATSAAALSIKGTGNKDLTQVSTNLTVIEGKIDTLTTTVGTINTNTSAILTKWGAYSASDIIGYVDGLETSLGTNGDACAATTVFGGLKCIRDKWGSQTATDLYSAANNAATTAAALRADLNYNGKVTNAYDDIQSIKTYVSAFDSLTSGEVSAAVWDADASSHNTAGTFGTKLQNAVPTAADIWASPSRTLTSFGSLVSDIWNYSTRSLTDFSTLVASIWSSPTRTLSSGDLDSGGKLSTKTDVDNATTSATTALKGAGNKDLTQVNTAVSTAQTSLNNVQTSLTTIEGKVDTLNTKADTISTNTTNILTKWGAYTFADVIGYVDGLETSLGTNGDACAASTVFGGIKCIRDKWGAQTADALFSSANSAATISAALRAELDYNGKSSTAYADIQAIKTFANAINSAVGSSGDLSSASTIFGKIQGSREDIASSVTSIKGPNNKNLSDVTTQVAGVQTSTGDLSDKIDALDTKVDGIDTKTASLLSKWGAYSLSDVITSLSSVTSGLGTSADACAVSSVFGQIKCVKDKWGSRTAEDIYTSAHNAESAATALRAELNYNGKSSTAYEDLQTLITHLNTVQTLIGATSDGAATASLYGRIQRVRETVEDLDTSGAGLSDLLAKWGSYSATDIYDAVSNISGNVSDSNSIPDVSEILSISKSNVTDLQSLKNSVLALQALTLANKALLEGGTASPIIQTWLEEGSIIFKTLITNPSSIRQDIPIKFYLPKEADKKDIEKIDDGLTVGFDPTADSYFVTGEINLGPGQTHIYSVEVTDVWKISKQELDSLRLQAKELYEPLKGTPYFAQGATLYADIIASLDTAGRLQAEAQTPEARIKAYREGLTYVTKAKTEADDLKTLGTSSSSNGNLLGFVGGIQTFAVWGLVLVLTAGFVFLAIYMKILTSHATSKGLQAKGGFNIKEMLTKNLARITSNKKNLALTGIITCIVAGLILGILFITSPKPIHDQAKQVEGATDKASAHETKTNDVLSATTKDLVMIVNVGTSGANLREGPSTATKALTKVKPGTIGNKINSLTGWTQIEVDVDASASSHFKGWVKNDYIDDVQK